MFHKLYDWHRNYARKHPVLCHVLVTGLGVSFIWTAGYAEALFDNGWTTAGGILGIILGLEFIDTGIGYLDETDY
jgi:hypothetical protein